MAKFILGISLFLVLFLTVPAQKPLFSTETGYDLSFERSELNQRVLPWRELARATGASPPEGLDNCRPVGSYVIYREGTSLPEEAEIAALNALQNKMRSTTINPAFRFLSQIPNSRIPIASAGDLAEFGRREMQELASRIKTRFSEFFSNPDIDLSRFSFQSTNSSSSIESAVAFARGLVGLNQICEILSAVGNVTVACSENSRLNRFITPTSAFVSHDPADMDPLLRPYNTPSQKECLNSVNNGRTDQEVMKYKMGRDTMQLHNNIAKKLSLPGSQQLWNISRDEVQLLAKICGYHLAMFNDNNTWCRLFDYEDLNVAEYQRELRHYWDESYGFPINSITACPLINDTLDYFNRLASRGAGAGASLPLMTFKFTDANTLIRLVSLLGVAKDPRMLESGNYAQSRNRQFRTAKMAPFAGNLAINLYRCEEPQVMFFNDQVFRVQVLLNERPLNITFCQDAFCDLKDFKRELMAQAGQCKVEEACNVASGLNPDGSRRIPVGGRKPGSDASGITASRLLIALTAMMTMAKISVNWL